MEKILIRRSGAVEIIANGAHCIGSIWKSLSTPKKIYFTATSTLTPEQMRLIADEMEKHLIKTETI